jgi:hypothetical protein
LLVEHQSSGIPEAFGASSMTKGYFVLIPPASTNDSPVVTLLMKVFNADSILLLRRVKYSGFWYSFTITRLPCKFIVYIRIPFR